MVVTVEAFRSATGGCVISLVALHADRTALFSTITLAESGLRGYDVTVPAIVREGKAAPNIRARVDGIYSGKDALKL